jgi:hypothetical protein
LTVYLEGGELVRVKAYVSPPFGCFAGTDKGPTGYYGGRRHVLVFLATSRPIATLPSCRACKLLASEIAPALIRGELPDPASILKTYL